MSEGWYNQVVINGNNSCGGGRGRSHGINVKITNIQDFKTSGNHLCADQLCNSVTVGKVQTLGNVLEVL